MASGTLSIKLMLKLIIKLLSMLRRGEKVLVHVVEQMLTHPEALLLVHSVYKGRALL